MRISHATAALPLIIAIAACAASPDDITSTATGDVITDVTARGTGGGAPFDGHVDSASDLEDLVETAWGDGSLGLHRGHAPIEGALEAFLGIDHDEMHVLMEQANLNLAGVCERLGLEPENLVDTLTASFSPYLDEGVDGGVLDPEEVPLWTGRIRGEFARRVYWEG